MSELSRMNKHQRKKRTRWMMPHLLLMLLHRSSRHARKKNGESELPDASRMHQEVHYWMDKMRRHR
jgi:hypothetical protein